MADAWVPGTGNSVPGISQEQEVDHERVLNAYFHANELYGVLSLKRGEQRPNFYTSPG